MGTLIKSGKISLDCRPVNLCALIDRVTEDTALVSYSHQISVVQGDPFMVNADADKITLVISNLLSNAIKYSSVGTNIEICCERDENFASVSVKDEGPGIKPSDQERIFERFYRIESTATRVIPGFGIGLYLCAEIIERHGGKIGVKSEPDKGSVFYFTLPID